MRVSIVLGSEVISKPVDAITGWKILQLLGIIETELPPLSLEELERRHIERALDERGDKSLTELADELGIAKKTLWVKRKKYNRKIYPTGRKMKKSKPKSRPKQDRESLKREAGPYKIEVISKEQAEKELKGS